MKVLCVVICVREAKADIEMDAGQEEEEVDPGPFCRNSPIRKIVVTLRLDCFLSGEPPCQVKARWNRYFISAHIFDIVTATEMIFRCDCWRMLKVTIYLKNLTATIFVEIKFNCFEDQMVVNNRQNFVFIGFHRTSNPLIFLWMSNTEVVLIPINKIACLNSLKRLFFPANMAKVGTGTGFEATAFNNHQTFPLIFDKM